MNEQHYNKALTEHIVESPIAIVLNELGGAGIEAHANVYPGTGTIQLTLKGERADLATVLHCWLDGLAQRNLAAEDGEDQ